MEGSDKVGKTTLCEKIASKIGGKIHHWGLLPGDHDFYFSYLPHMGYDVVWDRGHYSELAYQAAIARPARVHRDELRMVDSELFRWGCIYVVVTAGVMTLSERLFHMEDDKFDATIIHRVNNWFRDEYRGPLDYEIRCVHGKLWPSDEDVDTIVAMHKERTRVMRSLRERLSSMRSYRHHLSDSRVSGLRD